MQAGSLWQSESECNVLLTPYTEMSFNGWQAVASSAAINQIKPLTLQMKLRFMHFIDGNKAATIWLEISFLFLKIYVLFVLLLLLL